jgi:hypothetical protein
MEWDGDCGRGLLSREAFLIAAGSVPGIATFYTAVSYQWHRCDYHSSLHFLKGLFTYLVTTE